MSRHKCPVNNGYSSVSVKSGWGIKSSMGYGTTINITISVFILLNTRPFCAPTLWTGALASYIVLGVNISLCCLFLSAQDILSGFWHSRYVTNMVIPVTDSTNRKHWLESWHIVTYVIAGLPSKSPNLPLNQHFRQIAWAHPVTTIARNARCPKIILPGQTSTRSESLIRWSIRWLDKDVNRKLLPTLPSRAAVVWMLPSLPGVSRQWS